MTTSLDIPEAAEVLPEPDAIALVALATVEARRRPQSWAVKLWYGLCWTLEWLFGLASLFATLAVLAAIPIVNFLTLG